MSIEDNFSAQADAFAFAANDADQSPADSATQPVVLAQNAVQQDGESASDAAENQPPVPTPSQVRADENNIVHLPAGAAIDVIRAEGQNLVLVQDDGSEIIVLGGALDIPTFIIGDVEIPEVALLAALEANGIEVAAGPNGNAVSSRSQSSGNNFNDGAPDGIGASGPQFSSLLSDTQNGEGTGSGVEELQGEGNNAPVITSGAQLGAMVESADNPGGIDADPATVSGVISFFDPDLGNIFTATASAGTFGGASMNNGGVLTPAQISAFLGGFSIGQPAAQNVSWSYSLPNSAVDFLGAGETVTLTFDVTISDGYASVVQPITITVTGTNDAPLIEGGDTTGAVREIADGNPNEGSRDRTVDGVINFSDVDATDTHSVSSITPQGAGYLGNLAATVASPAAGGTGTLAWEFSVPDADIEFLAQGEVLVQRYDIEVSDGNGGTFTETVRIRIVGRNDAPELEASTGSITELADQTLNFTAQTVFGSSSFTDIDLSDVGHSAAITGYTVTGEADNIPTGFLGNILVRSWMSIDSVTKASGSDSGQVNWRFSAADAAFDYLAEGQSVTITYDVEVDDGDGGTSASTIAVTIHGSNDRPIFLPGGRSDSFNERADVTGSGEVRTASSIIAFVDADREITGHTAAVTGLTASGETGGLNLAALQTALSVNASSAIVGTGVGGLVSWNFAAADSAFDYLAHGESVTLNYLVTLNDGSGAANAANTTTVSVTITGRNDRPVISTAPYDVDLTEVNNTTGGAAVLSASGDVNVADVDLTDTHTIYADAPAAQWSGGTLTAGQAAAVTAGFVMNADGTWVYNVSDSAVDFLSAGETLTITTQVYARDDSGRANDTSAPQTLTITITGSNDRPVLSSATGNTTEYTDTTLNFTAQTVVGASNFTDADLNETGHTASIRGHSVSGETDGMPSGILGNILVRSWLDIDSVTKLAGSNAGTVNWSFSAADANFDYLAEGQSVTITYDVRVNGPDGGRSDSTVAITIYGTNDRPQFLLGDYSDSFRELPGVTGSPVVRSENGTILFSDADREITGHTASVTGFTATGETGGLNTAALSTALSITSVSSTIVGLLNNVGGTVNWAFAAPDSAFDYLAEGETVTLQYQVTLNDGSGAANAATTTTVSITVTGRNDAPAVAAINGGNVSEDGALQVINLLAGQTDVDGDALTAQNITVTDDLGNPVAFTDNGDGTISIDPGQYNGLDDGESRTVTVTYQVNDGRVSVGNTATLVVEGANDAPTVVAIDAGTVTEDDAVQVIDLLAGQTDVDGEPLTVQNITVTDNLGNPVTFTDNGNGTISIDPFQFDALNTGESRTVTVNYEVSDGTAAVANTATLMVDGITDNRPPVANDDLITRQSEFVVNSFTANNQSKPSVAILNNGNMLFVWHSEDQAQPQDQENSAIKARILTTGGDEVIAEFVVNEFPQSYQYDPKAVPLANGGFAVFWRSSDGQQPEDTLSHAIKARFFDANGVETVSEFVVNTFAPEMQVLDDVTVLGNGNILVTWYSRDGQQADTSGMAIKGAVLDQNGNEVVGEFVVNELFPGDQNLSSITALDDGGYMVTWTTRNGFALGDTSGDAVVGGIFNAAGVRVTPDFIINDVRAGDQSRSDVAQLANTLVVITWQSTDGLTADNSGSSIKAKIIVPNGTPLFSEFLVNTYTQGNQTTPKVAALANGNFVITWSSQSDAQSGGGYAIKAKIFDGLGNVVVGEFVVNEFSNTGSYWPQVEALSDGGFVITWQSDDQQQSDVSGSAAKGRMFDADGTPRSFGGIYEDGVNIIKASQLLGNDTDPDGDTLAIQSVDGTSNLGATVTLNGDGSVSYDASGVAIIQALKAGETLTDTFDYTITDGNGETSTATVTVVVIGENDAPTVTVINAGSVSEDAPVQVVNLLAGQTDVDGDALTAQNITVTDNLGNPVAFTDNGNGTISIDPNQFTALKGGESRSVTVNYQVSDGTVSVANTATLVVNGANDAPTVVTIDAGTVSEDAPVQVIDLLAGQTDVDGDALTAQNITVTDNLGNPVAFTNNGNGTISVDPNQLTSLKVGESRTLTVNYEVSDGTAAVANTASLVVTGENDAPVANDDPALQPLPLGEFQVNTTTLGEQGWPWGAVVTELNDGTYVAVWSSMQQDGSSWGIIGQRLDADLQPIGGEFIVNTTTAGNQSMATVSALSDGGFVVSWASITAAHTAIVSQRFDASGSAVGGEQSVNTATASTQDMPLVAGLAGGGHVVLWVSQNSLGQGNEIIGRVYNVSGTPSTTEFVVNTATAGDQNSPALIALSTGGFFVSWTDNNGLDGSGPGIFGQFFNAAGGVVGGQIQLNGYTASTQLAPTVTELENGNLAVSWTTAGLDGSSYGVVARIFTPAGVPVGPEFVVNSYTAGTQSVSHIAALSDGGFVVTWNSNGQDGSGFGVYAQRFDANGLAVGSEFRASVATDDTQYMPFVIAVEGGFAIFYVSPDAALSGIFMQRFLTEITANEDSGVILQPQVLLGNDVDPDGDTLTIQSVSGTSNLGATITLNGDGSVNYNSSAVAAIQALKAGETLTDTFSYTVSDGNGGTDTATVTLTVKGENDAPTVTAISAGTVSEDGALQIIDLLAGQTDVDGDALTAQNITVTDNLGNPVVFTDNGNGTISIDPSQFDALNNGESRTITVNYNVSDGTTTVANTASLTVNGATDVPPSLAVADTIKALPSGWALNTDNGHIYKWVSTNTLWADAVTNAAAQLPGQSYLATVTSASEDAFIRALNGSTRGHLGGSDAALEGTWVWVTGPEAGQVFYAGGVAQNGAYVNWLPGEPSLVDGNGFEEDYLATALGGQWNDVSSANSSLPSIGYTAEAGGNGVSYGVITEDAPYSFSQAILLANDANAPAAIQSVSGTSALGASVTFNPGTGVITYNGTGSAAVQALKAGQVGTDSFTYTIDDGQGGTSTATVNIEVMGINDAAVIGGVTTGSVTEDTGYDLGGNLRASGILTISDADTGEASFQAGTVTTSLGGSLTINAAGQWNYSISNADSDVQNLNSGQSVIDTATVLSADGTTQAISITINGVNEVPGFFGKEIQYSYIYGNNKNAAIATTLDSKAVGASVEYTGKSHSGSSVFSVDVDNTGFTVTFATGGTFSNSENFNGFRISDAADNLKQILSATTTQAGVGLERDANNVYLNLRGLTFSAGDSFRVNVALGSSGNDPLVLDLGAVGISLAAASWLGGGEGSEDGLLVWDLDNSGTIDGLSEILSPEFNGGGHADSLRALKTLDSNEDGVFSAGDEAFSSVKVWVDANGNGVADEGELLGLTDHNIVEIDLNAAAVDWEVEGERVFADGLMRLSSGETRQYLGVEFGEDGGTTTITDNAAGGEAGNILVGQEGADTFVIDPAALGNAQLADMIVDYNAGEGDVVDLTDLLHDLGSAPQSVADVAAMIDLNGTDLQVMNDQGDMVTVAQFSANVTVINILYDDNAAPVEVS